MSSTVIFKQSFKPREASGTAGLNVRHLHYISTRPGAVYNRGCGFGLWGRLPQEQAARDLTDLTKAKQIVRAASADHTLYRAIVSVGQADAEKYGLYDRSAWERLVRDHIRDIAKEMDIRPENMCWCASFHCAKAHPHVHLLYWDNSPQPRQDLIPKPVWNSKAERIRAAFSGDIHRDEIRQIQQTLQEQREALRQAVQALCQEANPEKTVDLAKLFKNGGAADNLSQDLEMLLRQLPAKGSLRYAYLPSEYKQLVDKLVGKALELPELKAELKRYESAVRQVSQLYGNSAESANAELEKAREKLRRELGNLVMKAVREMGDELRLAGMAGSSPAHTVIRMAMKEVVPTLESYRELVNMMPGERIPMGVMYDQIPDFREQQNRVVEDVLRDARIRLAFQGCALRQAGIDLESLPDASGGQLFGKALTQEQREAYLECYRQQMQELREEITAQACQDAGWTEEAMRTGAAGLVMGMMRFLSQMASQRQAAAGQGGRDRWRSRDRSKEQRKDERATKQLSGSWEPG